MIHKDKTRETDNTGNIKTGKMKQLINKVEMGKKDNNRKSRFSCLKTFILKTSDIPCLWFNARNMKQEFQMKNIHA